MKSKMLQLLVFMLFLSSLNAQNEISHPLNAQETLEVEQKLTAYDLGNVTYEKLTGDVDSRRMLAEYYLYLPPTNSVTTKMKLPISRSLAIVGLFPQAAQLAQDYVNVYSNDARGWNVLAGSEMMMKSYDKAIWAYTNVIRLGDDKNCRGLGGAALAADRMDVLEKIVVPRLLIQMDGTDKFSEKERVEIRWVLCAYSLKSHKEGMKQIFIQAVTGVDFSKLYQWPDLKNVISLGCHKFGGPDIDTIRRELNAATTDNPDSGATNSISSPPR